MYILHLGYVKINSYKLSYTIATDIMKQQSLDIK